MRIEGFAVIFLVYFLYLVSAGAMLLFSWRRSRTLLHPHFMFTIMLVVFMSDFLVRGYDDPNIDLIPLPDLLSYQMAVLISMWVIVIITATVRKPYESVVFGTAAGRVKLSTTTVKVIFLLAAIILIVELLKRLSAAEWSPVSVLSQMLGPRGFRDWDAEGGAGRNNALFQLLSLLLPTSATLFAYLMVVGQGFWRAASVPMFVIMMFILVTDGSRTPVVLALASLALFQVLYGQRLSRKILVGIFSVVSIALLTSFMYNFRSGGLLVGATGAESGLVYHQDDSLYRAWFSYYVASLTEDRWDAVEWFFTMLVNPIPRAIWPGKPLLDQAFYGNFKLDYVTTLFYGENVALFGPFGGTIFSTFFGIMLYRMFYAFQKLMVYPMGVATYIISSLYIYMTMRSSFNLTGFAYVPIISIIFIVLAYRYANFLEQRKTSIDVSWARGHRG